MFRAVSYPITIVELATYAADADRIFGIERHERLKEILAFNPEHGEFVEGTGGVRQFIWQSGDEGSEVQIVYFFHTLDIPLFLLAVCEDFDDGEFDEQFCAELMQLTAKLLAEYQSQREALLKAAKSTA